MKVIKHLMLAAFLACAGAARAATCNWTGGGDGTTWSQAANWDTAPISGNGDDIVINFKAATADKTITVGSAFSIGSLNITPSTNAVLTLAGAALTLTRSTDVTAKYQYCTLYVNGVHKWSGSGHNWGELVKISNNIVLPTAAYYTFGRNYNDTWFCGVEISGVISGPGTLVFASGGYDNYYVLSGKNTYTGDTVFCSGAQVHDLTGESFGASTNPLVVNGGWLFFRSGKDVTRDMDLTGASGGPSIYVYGDASIRGDIIGGTSFKSSLTIADRKSGTLDGKGQSLFPGPAAFGKLTIDGDIDIPNGSLALRAYNSTYPMTVNGAVTCATRVAGSNDNWNNGDIVLNGTMTCTNQFKIGQPPFKMGTGALAGEPPVYFCGWWTSVASFDLNGRDVTVGSISSEMNNTYLYSGHDFKASSAATLTCRAAEDAISMNGFSGALTFVYNPKSSGVTQTFTNGFTSTYSPVDRDHSMTGDLIVSNGTLRVVGQQTFNKVTRIEVAGGTFDYASTLGSSCSAVTLIEIGKNAKLKVSQAVPFLTSGVTVRLADSSGRLEVGEGVTLGFDHFYIGSEELEGNTYSGDSTKGAVIPQIMGLGVVEVMEAEIPTKAGRWVAGASDTKVTSLANWSTGTLLTDLTSKGFQPTFADAGKQAYFNQESNLKGVIFDIPGGQALNTFTLTGTGPLALQSLGVTALAPRTSEKYLYTLNVPTVIKKAQTWDLSPSNTVTVAVTQPFSGTRKVTTSGKGTLELRAESPNYDAIFELKGGATHVYAPEYAFGYESAGNPIVLDSKGSEAQLYLHGTTLTKQLSWNQRNQNYKDLFAVEGTNVLQEALIMNTDNTSPTITVDEGAYLKLSEWNISYDGNHWFYPVKYGKGVLELAGRCYAGAIHVREGTVRISAYCARGGSNPCDTSYELYLPSSRVEFTGSYGNSAWSSIQFWGTGGTVDLCGYDQMYGELTIGDANHTNISGELTSSKPATLKVLVSSDRNMRNVIITGALSFYLYSRYSTVYKLTFTKPMTTTGSFTITDYQAAEFTSTASWLNPTNGFVTVSKNARLTINKSKTFSSKMNFALSQAAVLEMAEGVSQRCVDLYLDGSGTPAEVGTWGATGSGAQHINDTHFAGRGVLDVRGSKPYGFMMVIP